MIWSDRALIAVLARLLPVRRAQNHDGSLSSTRDTQIPSASAFGALVTTDSLGPTTRLQPADSGNVCTLTVTDAGVSLQRCARSRRASTASSPRHVPPTSASPWRHCRPTGQHPLMTFRIGHSTATALRSPRRPADHVLLP
jgi:hypothetical protein